MGLISPAACQATCRAQSATCLAYSLTFSPNPALAQCNFYTTGIFVGIIPDAGSSYFRRFSCLIPVTTTASTSSTSTVTTSTATSTSTATASVTQSASVSVTRTRSVPTRSNSVSVSQKGFTSKPSKSAVGENKRYQVRNEDGDMNFEHFSSQGLTWKIYLFIFIYYFILFI